MATQIGAARRGPAGAAMRRRVDPFTIVLVAFAMLGVLAWSMYFSATSVYAQAGYPGGYRNPAEWYYCHADQRNSADSTFVGVPWGDIVCEHLLWQESTGGGGIYSSLQMEAGVSATGDTAAKVQGWVMPPAGMEWFEYHCTASAQKCRYGIGSATVAARSRVETSYFDFGAGAEWDAEPASPDPDTCATDSLDVVARYYSKALDNYLLRDPVPGWTTAGSTKGVGWLVEALATNANWTAAAEYSCSIVDWGSWTGYAPWLPGESDIVQPPPPTSTWGIPTPWSVPVTRPVGVGVVPQPTSCARGMWGYTNTVSAFGYTETVGFPEIEVCVQPYEVDAQFAGVDVGGPVLTFGLLLGLGVLVSVVKRA